MSVTTQLATMLAMIGMGSWLGAALDTYNRFLQRQNRKHWVVFINDVLFWIVQGLIIFTFCCSSMKASCAFTFF